MGCDGDPHPLLAAHSPPWVPAGGVAPHLPLRNRGASALCHSFSSPALGRKVISFPHPWLNYFLLAELLPTGYNHATQ